MFHRSSSICHSLSLIAVRTANKIERQQLQHQIRKYSAYNKIFAFHREKRLEQIDQLQTRKMSDYREEKDTMGIVRVPADRLYGAQTQRSRDNFRIGAEQNWDVEQMPKQIIHAFAVLKKACARVNQSYGELDEKLAKAIQQACDDVIDERLSIKDEFPLVIWQTGSGTQSNMNCNEVIANRASEILGQFVFSKNIAVNINKFFVFFQVVNVVPNVWYIQMIMLINHNHQTILIQPLCILLPLLKSIRYCCLLWKNYINH